MVAVGVVVTGDVVPYSLVAGVPARHVGWVCECGGRLGENLVCSCGKNMVEHSGVLPRPDRIFRPSRKGVA